MKVDQPLLERIRGIGDSLPETPVVRLQHPHLDLFAKLEFCNPGGSSKDRSAYWILRRAVERGDVREGTAVAESSSGNFALSMASFCRLLGLTFIPVIDPNVNAATERQLRLLCDRVEKVAEADATGGYLKARLARIQELRADIPPLYWPNQYANTDAVYAHEHATGAELCRALPALDYVFVGVSTAGTIAGLSTRVKQEFPGARVVAVDSEGSAIFGSPSRPRRIPGLGSSLVPPLLSKALIDDVVIVPEAEAAEGCRRLLSRHGIFAGGSTGSVYAAISRYFTGRETAGRPAVAFLCADRGGAYSDTLYDPAWVHHVLNADSVLPPVGTEVTAG
ncbi:2,3-diaminopropionate biosynthesis protein SbnA [Streptomyces sp. NRRL B-1677]|uniref:2,3-diaminopropionate biosynthesis protein SbnA n=1 Tax=Streptomyces sp. NRRL B-1677 TaxID=2682966 RepID=UPI001892AE3D|nr:2,3-diaminopropionate biosynthesis protein SbnA [Streptomyces sp. NRRL B-1677]